MGFKKVFPLNHLINNGVMAGTNTIISESVPIQNGDNFGLEVTWTGTPTGTLSVNCSNSGINYYSLTFNPALTQPTGAPGGYLINLNQLPFGFYQVSYTNSSGNGVLNVYAQGKDLN